MYMIIACVYLGMGLVHENDEHLSIDMIYMLLPERVIRGVKILYELLIILTMCIVFYKSISLIKISWKITTTALLISTSYMYLPIMIGSLLVVFHASIKVIAIIKQIK
jgi:TRAP-type C4-dicarboxylate transport system permease small subunit